ncbi:hypothetical protein ACFWN4_20920, partial [Streptomyces sp. NPDC058412]
DTWKLGTADGWVPECTANPVSLKGFPARSGVLAARGYEPHLEGVGNAEGEAAGAAAGEAGTAAPVVRMRNCPFHAVAERFPPLVCGMNLALLEGLLGADGPVRARMDARPGECCVVVEDSKNNDN